MEDYFIVLPLGALYNIDMQVIDEIPKTYEQAIESLISGHTNDAPPDLEIFLFPDPQKNSVRLVEVSDYFPTSGKLSAFTLGKTREFPFKSSVILIPHGEWKQALEGKLPMPPEWELDQKRKVWPE